MKLLAVTADDLGASAGVNEAIERAAAGGVLTQASLLATGEAFEDAVRRLRGRLPLGLHLNLTEGRSLTGTIRGATDGAGRFLGPWRVLLAAHARRIDLRAARAELAAQIERAAAAGVRPAHLDGHHHVHVLPGLLPLVLELACSSGARAVRVPFEPISPSGGARLTRVYLAWASRGARPRVRGAGLLTSDHFRGSSLYDAAPSAWPRLLAATLDTLPDGLTELMVHLRPGAQGEAQVAALAEGSLRERLARAAVRTISFTQAPHIRSE